MCGLGTHLFVKVGRPTSTRRQRSDLSSQAATCYYQSNQ